MYAATSTKNHKCKSVAGLVNTVASVAAMDGITVPELPDVSAPALDAPVVLRYAARLNMVRLSSGSGIALLTSALPPYHQ